MMGMRLFDRDMWLCPTWDFLEMLQKGPAGAIEHPEYWDVPRWNHSDFGRRLIGVSTSTSTAQPFQQHVPQTVCPTQKGLLRTLGVSDYVDSFEGPPCRFLLCCFCAVDTCIPTNVYKSDIQTNCPRLKSHTSKQSCEIRVIGFHTTCRCAHSYLEANQVQQ